MQDVQRTLRVVERELDLKGGAASFLMRIRPYRTMQDVIDGVVITFTDITANKRLQRTRELFIDELQHRTRNLLAVVQSISDTTLAEAGSLADYGTEFNDRLQALARVQGLLSRGDGVTSAQRDRASGACRAPLWRSNRGATEHVTMSANFALRPIVFASPHVWTH